jgi:hypothetical protein
MNDQPRLLLLGPSEWRQVQTLERYRALELARGARENVLARVSTSSSH